MYDLTAIEQYIKDKGWDSKPSNQKPDDLNVRLCPYCGNDKWAFYINRTTGLHNCQDCKRGGNLYTLRQEMGDEDESGLDIQSTKSSQRVKKKDLPDVEACHAALLLDHEALNYLESTRGYTLEIIKEAKLGVCQNYFLTLEKTCKALVIPYFKKGKLIYAKYRSLPPEPKAFDNTASGMWMYNMDALAPGIQELVIVEGEPDALATRSMGFKAVIGIPGANAGKADWLTKLEKSDIKLVYILFDNDEPGREAAHNWAVRIGLDKVRNVIMPKFTNADGKPGKDINDFMLWKLRSGMSREQVNEAFLELLRDARPFNINGVQPVTELLDELEQDILQHGLAALEPKIKSPWAPVNIRLGGANYGDLGGILAEGKVGKTTFAMNWLEFIVKEYNESCFNFCLEMPPKRLVRKWASFVTGTDDTPGKSMFTADTLRVAKIIANERSAELLFGYIRWTSHKQIFDTIRQVQKRYGVKVVCFDNLHLLIRNMDKTVQEVSILSKMFKDIAMELNILMILILQPNRVQPGQIVTSRNAKWSSDIEKDVDWLITLHRNQKLDINAAQFEQMNNVETEAALDDKILGNVDLSRYSAGGMFTLKIDGGRSNIYVPEANIMIKDSVPQEYLEDVSV